ncbi:MAG: alpha-N-acetylglucosaminidase TIM-barrel domain-containing protein [Lentisphaeria bacterium]|nr:alpha-N-acetylglucosaminidase TIM-barrel domain-containing protein [Lentisphaeria bacterium]
MPKSNKSMPTIHLIAGSEKAAARTFQKMVQQVTGRRLVLSADDALPTEGDLILIGSDASNLCTHRLRNAGVLPQMDLRTGTDDFQILSTVESGRNILLLAGGRIRATFYAVYDYFEQHACCRYHWDGDDLPRIASLPMQGIQRTQRFNLPYRGLRYFAHRSLHRFQAEHWDWPEWQQEIDWILKKQFNLFMLRTGLDDLFQKAFPELVSYPPDDKRLDATQTRSYNDRTSFWNLEYRAQLRKKILHYAQERDLIHPEDFGPITHWYSQTPADFLQQVQPEFLNQSSNNYQGAHSQVWDFRKEENFRNYVQLTRSHIRHYGRPDMFHMIGLAERQFGSEEENLQLKLYTYRRFLFYLRQHWPDAPILLASWDFMCRWNSTQVKQLLAELDPRNTIILDYTSDSGFHKNNYLTWELPGTFPWIYGIFQGLEPQNDLSFDLPQCRGQLAGLQDDSQCQGMVLWSESSHNNPYLLECISHFGKSGKILSLEEFCQYRYHPALADAMLGLWQDAEANFRLNAWVFDTDRPVHGIFRSHFNLLSTMASLEQRQTPEILEAEYQRILQTKPLPADFFPRIATLVEHLQKTSDDKALRDLFDFSRTALMNQISRELAALQIQLAKWHRKELPGTEIDPQRLVQWISILGKALALHPDYSLFTSLQILASNRPIHPDSADILKGNAENSYCRSFIAEFYPALYQPEAEFYCCWLQKKLENEDYTPALKGEFQEAAGKIREQFYATPLSDFAPDPHSWQPEMRSKIFREILPNIQKLLFV